MLTKVFNQHPLLSAFFILSIISTVFGGVHRIKTKKGKTIGVARVRPILFGYWFTGYANGVDFCFLVYE